MKSRRSGGDDAEQASSQTGTKCTICGLLPYRGREVLASAVADNPLWDFDAGLYELMHRVSLDTSGRKPTIEQERAEKIADKVQRHSKRLQSELVKVGLMSRENQTFSGAKEKVRWMAPLAKSELELGRLLGTGGFSSVFEIKDFHIDEETRPSGTTGYENAARKFLKTHAQESIDCPTIGKYRTSRYAVKHLRSTLLSEPDKFERAAIDLALEAQLLLVMDHPHIISIRGWTTGGPASYAHGRHTDYFVVLDKLSSTLEDAIGSWRLSLKKYQSRMKFPWSKKKYSTKIDNLFYKRVSLLHDVASALEYMHDRRLINRDLKAGNIGFDVVGDVKLFDFGLSRVLPSRCDMDEYYAMSRVGTKYYIAPEIKQKHPYNLSADMYSFGVVMWETMALATPREVLHQMRLHRDSEKNPASRLPMCHCCWPSSVVNLITACLSPEPKDRPTISSVRLALEEQMVGMTTPALERKRRRSTFRIDVKDFDFVVNTGEHTSNASSMNE